MEAKFTVLQSKLDRIGGKLSSFGAKWSLGVTTPIALSAKTAISAASDYEENLNKVDVAFGNSAQAVKDWADTATESFGLSKNQALEATSLFGDMATSMGLAQPAAADMATSMTGLAGDLASFKNIGIDQAMTALAGVFTGETESLKQLGIVMTEVNLEEFASRTGQVYSEMSQAEKVQLRYNYVMAMSKNAIGDYARTSDGTANSLRTFQGSVDNLAIAFGQQLLPTITPLVQSATELINRFAALDPEFQQLIIKAALFAAALGPVAVAAGGVASGISKVISVASGFTRAGSSLIGFVNNINIVRKSFNGMAAPLTVEQQKIANFATSAQKHFTSIMTSAVGMRTTMATTAKGVGTSLLSMGTAVKSAIVPFLPAIAVIGALAAAIMYLWQTDDGFRDSIISSWEQIKAAFEPVLQSMGTLITQVIAAITPAIQQLAQVFAELLPALTPIVTLIAGTFATALSAVAGLLTKVAQALAPVISQMATSLAPILQTIGDIITTYVVPAITTIATIVAKVINTVIQIVTPIITFIAETIAKIIEVVSTIVSKVASIFNKVYSTISSVWNKVSSVVSTVVNKIGSVISTIRDVASSVFNKIYSIVSSIMGKVRSVITNVFSKIKSAWNGLTSFVGGIFNGIASAVSSLVSKVKGVVNKVISGINFAIGIINKIPGVSIGRIGYLAHGTDNWQGGFAYMNEGGRGELVHLPNGAQVIPHDISVKYAKESARANATAEPIDLSGFMEGMVVQVINNTSVDGTPLRETMSDYVIKKIGNQQKAVMRAGGVYV